MAVKQKTTNTSSEFAGMAPIADLESDLKSKPADSGTPAREAVDKIKYGVVDRADNAIRGGFDKFRNARLKKTE